MIKAKVLGSGSKGNCTYININGYNLLLDAGLTMKRIKLELRKVNLSAQDINYVFITHSHQDHIKALKQIRKHCPHTMIFQPETQQFYFEIKKAQAVITAFEADHDIPCWSYKIDDLKDNTSLLYITDTGTVLCNSLQYMVDPVDILILEMNHDLSLLLKNNKYPDDLKIRITDTHLSNEQARDLIELIGTDRLKYFCAFHASEQNNNGALIAYEARRGLDKVSEKCKVIIAEQGGASEMMMAI